MSLTFVRLLRLVALPALIAILAASTAAAGSWPEMPDAATDGLARATEASGQEVPARDAAVTSPEEVDDEADDVDDDGDDVTLTDHDDTATDEQGDEEQRDGDTGGAGPAVAGENHGTLVSAAAHDCPVGTEHGACVREVARDNHGQETAAASRAKAGEDEVDVAADTEPGARGRSAEAASRRPDTAGSASHGHGRDARGGGSKGGRGSSGKSR